MTEAYEVCEGDHCWHGIMCCDCDMARPTVKAPWTPSQVKALNRWQKSPSVHPFTCGRRSEPGHGEYDGDLGTLLAIEEGWVCRDCDYTQDWAWPMMFDPPPEALKVDPNKVAELAVSLEEFWGRQDGSLSRAVGVGMGIMTHEEADELGWAR